MLGGMLAGTDECDGQWVTTDRGKKSLRFYGMSSREAQEKHHGGVKDYVAAEGRCVEVAYKGPVQDVLREVTGGLRWPVPTWAPTGSRTCPSVVPSYDAPGPAIRCSIERTSRPARALKAKTK